MFAIFARWIVIVFAVWVTTYIVDGIKYDSWQGLVIAALVMSIINTFVRPVLLLISLPFVMVTLGLFVFVINALVLMFTAWLVKDFHVAGFWSALGGSLIISVVSMLLGGVGRPQRRRPAAASTANDVPRNPPPGKGPIIDV